MAEASNHQITSCRVKWFDHVKGFGFLVPDDGGPDILLHANVLRAVGRNTVADGVRMDAAVMQVNGRLQATAIEKIHAAAGEVLPMLAQFADLDPIALRALPYQPARVKWFDPTKGFGFANVFGSSEDVFIHVEVLRTSGLAGLDAGEAVSLRVVDGERGRMAAEVAVWDQTSK